MFRYGGTKTAVLKTKGLDLKVSGINATAMNFSSVNKSRLLIEMIQSLAKSVRD